MIKNDLEIIASNLTQAFYAGQIRREAFLGEDRRTTLYTPNEDNRLPTVSPREVFAVYQRMLKMLREKR
ncbi:MAG: hypothetical protein IPN69_00850 [Acidobacteria bacterium]|nr:hypothetical protein [Acidobacteriota bacterium]